MEYDEAHIIQDVLEGKTSRYEYFLDKYGQQVFTLIVRIVASQEDAEELTQDTFLKSLPALIFIQSGKQLFDVDIPHRLQYCNFGRTKEKIRLI